MTRAQSCRLAFVLPLAAAVLLLGAAHRLSRRADANIRHCAACMRAARDLAPYIASLRAYEAALARFTAAGGSGATPAMPLGIPPAQRATTRGEAADGWIPVRETFSWPALKTGQAFAVLEAFTAPAAHLWRVDALALRALPDGEQASLDITLAGAEAAPAQE